MTCGVVWATRPDHAWKLLSTVPGNCQVLNKWECLYFLKFNSASKSLWAYKALVLCSKCSLNLEDSVLLYSYLIIIGQSPLLFADQIRSYIPQRPFPDGSSWTPPLTLILAHTLLNTLPDLGPNILSKGNTNNDCPIWSNSSPLVLILTSNWNIPVRNCYCVVTPSATKLLPSLHSPLTPRL